MHESEILNKAADYIEEHGWCRGRLQNEEGQVCLRGALHGAMEVLEPKSEDTVEDYKYRIDLAYDAECIVLGHIDENFSNIPTWNDYKAQSQEEVVNLLRDVAIKHQPDEMRSNPDTPVA